MKTVTEMQIIFNICNMRKVITGNEMDLDNLHKYDVNDMNEEELFNLQSNLIPYYNEAIKRK